MRDRRQRPDGARRRGQPVHAEEDPAGRARSRSANRLPMVNLVESGGADLPTQAEIFIPGGGVLPRPDPALGRPASRRSRWCSATPRPAARTCRACPTTRSWCATRPKVFLAGPPLVKMATGEDHRRRVARRRRHARRARTGLADYRRRGRARRRSAWPASAYAGSTGASAARRRGPPRRRAEVRRRGPARHRRRRPAGAVRPARGAGPGPRRQRVRRVQARRTARRW